MIFDDGPITPELLRDSPQQAHHMPSVLSTEVHPTRLAVQSVVVLAHPAHRGCVDDWGHLLKVRVCGGGSWDAWMIALFALSRHAQCVVQGADSKGIYKLSLLMLRQYVAVQDGAHAHTSISSTYITVQ